jgi:hypothetical protein
VVAGLRYEFFSSGDRPVFNPTFANENGGLRNSEPRRPQPLDATAGVMSSQDLECDGFYARHLLYVPTGVDDPNVVSADTFDAHAFFAWVDREGLGAGFVPRNGTQARWTKRFDFRFDQEFPTGGDTRGRIYLKMYNVANFLNEDWGNVWDAQFFSVQVVESEVNDQGQYVFNNFTDRPISDLIESRSNWEVRLGVGFRF